VHRCLDYELTVWDKYEDIDTEDEDVEPLVREYLEALQAHGEVEMPAFRLARLGSQLFKVPETAITKIYYWERSEDGEEEQFRRFCERNSLNGPTFTPLYSVESPW
jgi:hypothetical protein